MEISVILPAYNEESNIKKTVNRSLEALQSTFERFEIIIIDDASTDRTGEIADDFAAKHSQIKVIHNSKNLGQGTSILIGFKHAKYNLVIHNAMDYPFDLRDLSKMIPLLDEADIVVAMRTRRAGYTLYRKIISIINVTLLNLLFGLHLRDYNFVQLYKRSVLDKIQVDSCSTGFMVPEMLIRANDLGYRIKEIKIDYWARRSGVPTSGRPRVILTSMYDMLKFFLKRTRTSVQYSRWKW